LAAHFGNKLPAERGDPTRDRMNWNTTNADRINLIVRRLLMVTTWSATARPCHSPFTWPAFWVEADGGRSSTRRGCIGFVPKARSARRARRRTKCSTLPQCPRPFLRSWFFSTLSRHKPPIRRRHASWPNCFVYFPTNQRGGGFR
jgi:hypothetical protein